ncbi:MAG: membrane protein insertase YidC [Flavobacteriales bacterium]|nr:membrane protein insertase YidC [Flavobacteriales bacterium]
MDRNTIIGVLLILGIIITFAIINKPSDEQIARQKFIRDSIQNAKNMQLAADSAAAAQTSGSLTSDSLTVVNDSAQTSLRSDLYGPFAESAEGSSELIRIENDVMVMYFSPKGGKIHKVELKEYQNYATKEPVSLFIPEKSNYQIPLTVGTRRFTTADLFFSTSAKSTVISGEQTVQLPFRIYAGGNDKYIEFLYTVKANEYMIGFDVNLVGMQSVLNPLVPLEMQWTQVTPVQEKDAEQEKSRTTIYYKNQKGKVKSLSSGKSDDENLDASPSWIGFSQHFFTTTLISETGIQQPVILKTQRGEEEADFIRSYEASFRIPYDGKPVHNISMSLYMGPKDYKILRKYKGQDLEEQISLGWWLFRYVNTWVIINLFQWLDGFNLSYGIIILILTLIVKLALSPITYKTYLSSAKMRVLKPDIDALNEKFKDADPLKKQQETMNLYRKAGVNPLSGCIPALLQMPILFAIFQFFPSSIELRGQGFLWADDLSSWDSIASLPFNIPFYGNHVSLFTLLMTVTTMIYTSMTQTNMGSGAQAKQMKIMMYIMPIMFLGVLNSYSSALSYYYFLANSISILQTLFIRRFVIDENKLRAKIDENKKRPDKPKSGWAAKLEQMQKVQQQRAEELSKKNKKK